MVAAFPELIVTAEIAEDAGQDQAKPGLAIAAGMSDIPLGTSKFVQPPPDEDNPTTPAKDQDKMAFPIQEEGMGGMVGVADQSTGLKPLGQHKTVEGVPQTPPAEKRPHARKWWRLGAAAARHKIAHHGPGSNKGLHSSRPRMLEWTDSCSASTE